MSNYRNFIEDFPNRCRDLLLLAYEDAAAKDREVTLTLMVASAGFLIPFERLRNDGLYIQPSRDREKFPEVTQKLDQLLVQPWKDSPFGKEGAGSWSTGPLKYPNAPVEGWAELINLQPLSLSTTVGNIVKIIRHGLAHGNIYTRPAAQGQIQAIVFVSGGENRNTGKLKPYEFIHVSPADFRRFLLTWFKLLASWKVSQEEVLQALEQAA